MLKFLCVWMLLSVGLGGCCQSHKANLALPPSFNRRLNGPGNGTPPGVVCPEVAAGSCLFFSEACVHATHGFLDPRHKRRVLLHKYAQKHVAQGQDAVPPVQVALTERQALLFSPSQEGRAATFRPLDNRH